MFRIEWLAKGAVIASEESSQPTVEGTVQTAISQVAGMKSRFPANPPESLRIIDRHGLLVTSILLVGPGDGSKRFR